MYLGFPNTSIDYLDGNRYVKKDKSNLKTNIKPPLEFSKKIFLRTMWNRTWDFNNTHVDGDMNKVR